MPRDGAMRPAHGGTVRERAAAVAAWFGPRLRELRARAGLSQAALAKLVGIAQSRVAEYESETTRYAPSWETVVAIALALDVSTEVFLREPERPPPRKIRSPD
jgi:transcriptional regulator with XRE-family HTH domain